MSQICIRFDNDTETTLREEAKANDMTISNYLRHLIKVGCHTEDLDKHKNSTPHSASNFTDEALRELHLKSIKSSIENLILTRYIYKTVCNTSDEQAHALLKSISDKSQALINNYSVHFIYPDVDGPGDDAE